MNKTVFKYYLAFHALLFANSLFAQTNTFPTSGNVGIGTTSPAGKLEVKGATGVDLVNFFTSVGAGSYVEIGPSGTTAELASDSSGNFSLSHYGIAGGAFRSLRNGAVGNTLVLNSGNVGVGTATPTYALSFGSTLGKVFALFENPGGANLYGMASGGNAAGGADPYRTKVFANGLEAISVTYNGSIGLGIASPTAKLHVFTSSMAKAIFGRDDGAVPENSLVRINSAGASNFSGLGFDAGPAASSGATIWLPTAGNGLYFSGGVPYSGLATAAPHMTITAAGGVGIGTTNPGSNRLAVNGTIRAKEVVVDTGWSDYVFDENYRLAPLAEVEQHIKMKKHLPGIPSAAKVGEHGIGVGEMQSKLLAKIEELTLHQIAQEKEIDRLREKVANLESNGREHVISALSLEPNEK